MSETSIQSKILIALGSTPGTRLFRNTIGDGWQGEVIERNGDIAVLRNARYTKFGLVPGSGDLIGFRSIEITPDMIGKRLAVFTSVEVKAARGVVRDAQGKWADMVARHGGFAGVARSVDEAKRLFD